MTQSLYEATLSVSKLQRNYPDPIKIVILTRDQTLFARLKSVTTIKLQSEHDRSTNSAIKYGILTIGNQVSKMLETEITQTANLEIVNHARDACTIFGIILATTTEKHADVTYSTNFDDVSTTLGISTKLLLKYQKPNSNLPQVQSLNVQISTTEPDSDDECSKTPVTQTDDTFTLIGLTNQLNESITVPQFDDDMILSIERDFLSTHTRSIKFEKQLGNTFAILGSTMTPRNAITRPQAERWFLLLSKLALPKMESWITPVDQDFVAKCDQQLLEQPTKIVPTLINYIQTIVNFEYKEQSLTLLDIILGLHTKAEILAIKSKTTHSCSFLISCPFQHMRMLHNFGELNCDNFYRYYLQIVALQIHSLYDQTKLNQLTQDPSDLS